MYFLNLDLPYLPDIEYKLRLQLQTKFLLHRLHKKKVTLILLKDYKCLQDKDYNYLSQNKTSFLLDNQYKQKLNYLHYLHFVNQLCIVCKILHLHQNMSQLGIYYKIRLQLTNMSLLNTRCKLSPYNKVGKFLEGKAEN